MNLRKPPTYFLLKEIDELLSCTLVLSPKVQEEIKDEPCQTWIKQHPQKKQRFNTFCEYLTNIANLWDNNINLKSKKSNLSNKTKSYLKNNKKLLITKPDRKHFIDKFF